MSKKQIEQLAREHWEWLKPILLFIGRPLTIEEVEYIARTFMEHGYKHGQDLKSNFKSLK